MVERYEDADVPDRRHHYLADYHHRALRSVYSQITAKVYSDSNNPIPAVIASKRHS